MGKVAYFRSVTPNEAIHAVDKLVHWSDWCPFNETTVATAPQVPGVYLFRLPDSHDIVYVGMAGERGGSGIAQGIRGRLRIYSRGRGAVSGFGEAALDHALADPDWIESQLLALRTVGPKRTKVWAQEAIAHLAPEVRWTECTSKADALQVEAQVESLLGPHTLWNRAAQKSRAALMVAAPTPVSPAVAPAPQDSPPTHDLAEHAFSLKGYDIDLNVLYRAMYDHSTVDDNGVRVFDGNAKGTPAVKRLLHELFDVPVTDNIHPVNNAIRSECRDRLHALGWATKGPGRSARYELHRTL